MNIDFSAIPVKVIPHMRGGEKEFHVSMFTDSLTKIMKGRLAPGASVGLHTHDTNCEVMYFLSGTGKVLNGDAYDSVGPGTCHYCPRGHAHSLINDGESDLVFFAIVPEQPEQENF